MEQIQKTVSGLSDNDLFVEYRRVFLRQFSESITKRGMTQGTYIKGYIILEELTRRFGLDIDYILEQSLIEQREDMSFH